MPRPKFSLRKLLIGAIVLGAGTGMYGKYVEDNKFPKYLFDGNINGKRIRLTDVETRRYLQIDTENLEMRELYVDYGKDGSLDDYYRTNEGDPIGVGFTTRFGMITQDQTDYNNYINKLKTPPKK